MVVNDVTMSAWIELHRANRVLLDAVEKALKQKQLPPLDWYDVLLELSRDSHNGLRQYEIGAKVLLNKHNLSRLLDRLEAKDLLSRQACEEDGRGNRVKITHKGEQTIQAMWPVYSGVMQSLFGDKLGYEELQQLAQMLRKIRA
ncbi:MAG: MarR family transcriptional regulator [Gammaproteobacteria bacterium]|nr:MarR family transcriptional regulator [Gammaproteobacteria bacterium]MDH5800592.1 MarR family transcriptional regulator [Gammaproteobacteria bacterium]